MQLFKKMVSSSKGVLDHAVEVVIAVVVILLILATIGGQALTTFFGTNTSTWGASTVTNWNSLPSILMTFIVLGIVFALVILYKRGRGRGG